MNVAFKLSIQPIENEARDRRTTSVYKELRQFERDIGLHAGEHAPETPFDGPISLGLIFVLKKPARPKHEKPITNPSLPYLVNTVIGSLNGLFWNLDAQVTNLRVKKTYCQRDEKPHIMVAIEGEWL